MNSEQQIRPQINQYRAAAGLCFALALLLPLFLGPFASPVIAETSPIHTIYVAPFEGKIGSAQLRSLVIQRLRSTGKWQIADQPSQADAIVHGNGELWIRSYVTTRGRSEVGPREPVYGGYLSVDVRNRAGEVLWSWLVTPGRLHWNGVGQDMADHIVRLMVVALARTSSPAAEAATATGKGVSLSGAGSTFAAPLYQEWIESYAEQHPSIRTSYQAVGSEEGIHLLQQGKVDFAASDVPLSDQQMTDLHLRVENIATVLGGVVPAYNLPGFGNDLRFTPELLAQIYLGKIRNWNDPQLRAINHGASLPNQPIVVVHRADGSGTSFAWTSFLSATSPAWKAAVGEGMRVSWPVGIAATGNDGVAARVAETPGAIGYVELTYAIREELSFGLVRNAAGKFVQANLASLSTAAKAAPLRGDLRASLLNAAGGDAYPIATLTWILLPSTPVSPQKSAALRDLLRWMLTAGQKECSGLGYLPLPQAIAERELRQTVPGLVPASSTSAAPAPFPPAL